MRIGIVGDGVVGKHLAQTFNSSGITRLVYDKDLTKSKNNCTREAINGCDLVFIAVPTPSDSGGQCDLTAVEEVVSWVRPPMCIKSTVIPGTTDRLASKTGKNIVFSPEYVGETPFHKYKHTAQPDLIVVGGELQTRELFLDAYRSVFGPQPRYFSIDAVTAELSKYMENCFFATKVAFVAQFYLLASQFGVDFTQLREIWVADTRVGRSHSAVIGSLGFSGRCLPKDLSAIITAAKQNGHAPRLLEAVLDFNNDLHRET